MKKIMGTTAFLLFAIIIAAQPVKTVKGIVTDAITKEPVSGAIISAKQTQTIADEKGNFILKNVKDATISISSIGYKTNSFTVSNENSTTQLFQLIQIPLFLQPLEVKAIRASKGWRNKGI